MRTEELNRLRWQCRRGLLELDVLLERFLEKHGDRLQGERLSSFQTLLTFADNELLDLIRERTECRDARLAEVVQWMRNCRSGTGSQCSTDCREDDDGVHS
jgi:antitoxin CptB